VTDMKKRGYNLIEVLIGLAILAIIATVFMQALGVGILGAYRDSQMNKALHLAQSQMEYIKSQPYLYYDNDCDPLVDAYNPSAEPPVGFNVINTVCNMSVNSQNITVTVTYDDNRTITVEGYKTNR